MRLKPIVAPSRVGHQWHTQAYDMFHLVQHNPSNQQFFVVSPAQQAAFEQAVGAETFYVLDAGRKVVRFVTSWATSRGDADDLLEFAATIA